MNGEPADLAAIEHIQRLKAEYFRLADLKRWDEWEKLFTSDLTYFSGRAANPRFVTAAAFVGYVRGALAGARTVHAGTMEEIVITSPRTARATWAMSDSIDSPATGHFEGTGRYHETYEAADGGHQWRFSSIRLVR